MERRNDDQLNQLIRLIQDECARRLDTPKRLPDKRRIREFWKRIMRNLEAPTKEEAENIIERAAGNRAQDDAVRRRSAHIIDNARNLNSEETNRILGGNADTLEFRPRNTQPRNI